MPGQICVLLAPQSNDVAVAWVPLVQDARENVTRLSIGLGSRSPRPTTWHMRLSMVSITHTADALRIILCFMMRVGCGRHEDGGVIRSKMSCKFIAGASRCLSVWPLVRGTYGDRLVVPQVGEVPHRQTTAAATAGCPRDGGDLDVTSKRCGLPSKGSIVFQASMGSHQTLPKIERHQPPTLPTGSWSKICF